MHTTSCGDFWWHVHHDLGIESRREKWFGMERELNQFNKTTTLYGSGGRVVEESNKRECDKKSQETDQGSTVTLVPDN